MKNVKRKTTMGLMFIIFLTSLLLTPTSIKAHCDSYDGPVIKDAFRAIENNQVEPVLKWVNSEHEDEISSLFKKLITLKNGDAEIYAIVEKHFLETLVRLHREGEGASYTGLKPAGTTKPIILISDNALEHEDYEGLIHKLEAHFAKVLKEKYDAVVDAKARKDDSVENGREYVEAYVEYTHFIEEIHDIIEHGSGSHGHSH
jgi:hypothetical protein